MSERTDREIIVAAVKQVQLLLATYVGPKGGMCEAEVISARLGTLNDEKVVLAVRSESRRAEMKVVSDAA